MNNTITFNKAAMFSLEQLLPEKLSITVRTAERIRQVLICGLFWSIAKLFFTAVKVWGVESVVLGDLPFSLGTMYEIQAITGFLNGVLFGLIEIAVEERMQRVRQVNIILMKAALYPVIATSITLFVSPLLTSAEGFDSTYIATIVLKPETIIPAIAFVMVLATLTHIGKQLLSWLNTNDFIEHMKGKPSAEEERILMFLDLKDSTHHAEVLGHQRFSALLSDCFSDTTGVLRETGAEVYQYVGDEIILTWKADSSWSFANSMNFYIRFKETLFRNAAAYREKYGIIPEFKAGLHCGIVMKAQIGITKKEIAYHGDAMNTTARIQGKCNELNADLLVSEPFKMQLPKNYRFQWEGTHLLKGKETKINLYSFKNYSHVIPHSGAQSRDELMAVLG